MLMYCERNLYAPFVVRRYEKQKQYDLCDCEMMHKEKVCRADGLKYVAGTSYMTNVNLLLTANFWILCAEAKEVAEYRAWLPWLPGVASVRHALR